MFSKKAKKFDKIFTVDLTLTKDLFIKIRTRTVVKLLLILYEFFMNESLVSVKSTVKILSNFVAFLENTNFTRFELMPHFIHAFLLGTRLKAIQSETRLENLLIV